MPQYHTMPPPTPRHAQPEDVSSRESRKELHIWTTRDQESQRSTNAQFSKLLFAHTNSGSNCTAQCNLDKEPNDRCRTHLFLFQFCRHLTLQSINSIRIHE